MKISKSKKEYKKPTLKKLGSLKQIIRGVTGPFPELGDSTHILPVS